MHLQSRRNGMIRESRTIPWRRSGRSSTTSFAIAGVDEQNFRDLGVELQVMQPPVHQREVLSVIATMFSAFA